MSIYVRNFNVSVIDNTNGVFFTNSGNQVLDIHTDTNILKWCPTVILADPFLFKLGDTLFLFYERQEKWYGKGKICMRKTSDLQTWTEEVDVLIEPFHLSFPNVFDFNDKIYMLPETGGGGYIGLYEALDDTLEHWKLKKKLIEDAEPWYDSDIFEKDGTFYLFTSKDDNVEQVQHLFIANDLFGPYEEHPCSPIYKGCDGGRNAGSIIKRNGELFRPIQICKNSYGEQTSIMKIETITPTEYKEYLYKEKIYDTSISPYKEGGHQFNYVEFKGKTVIATDYRCKNYNVIELIRRIKHHL